jgi:hypothetical protein
MSHPLRAIPAADALRVGPPIPTTGMDVDELVALARERVQALLPLYVEPPGWKPFRRRLTRLLY